MKHYDLVIIGGGASGLNSAIFAKEMGIENILLIEKDDILGGALTLGDYNLSERSYFTGEEYRQKLIQEFDSLNINTYLGTMVLKIEDNKIIVCTSKERGIEKIKANSIVIATGGKETYLNNLQVTGDRVAGILTVGMTEKILNMGLIPGKEVVIYGNNNLYKIYNKLKKSNVNIKAVICDKVSDESLSLSKNLYLGYDLKEVKGNGRLQKIKVSNGRGDKYINCDTLIVANPMICDPVLCMRSGIKLNLETMGAEVSSTNMTSSDGVFALGYSVKIYNSIEEILEDVTKTINSVLKYLKNNIKYDIKFTCDIKQAYKSNENPLHYIDIMGKDLVNFHINDRDEKSICLLPGKGRVNYKPIIEKLKTLDYKGPLIIEVYRDNFKTYEELKDVKDFIEKKLLV